MKVSELREMSPEELRRKIGELYDDVFKLRMRRSTEQLPNPLRLRMLRRDVARCLTVLREKAVPIQAETEKSDG